MDLLLCFSFAFSSFSLLNSFVALFWHSSFFLYYYFYYYFFWFDKTILHVSVWLVHLILQSFHAKSTLSSFSFRIFWINSDCRREKTLSCLMPPSKFYMWALTFKIRWMMNTLFRGLRLDSFVNIKFLFFFIWLIKA